MSLSGCPGEEEDEDGQILTLVTDKIRFKSSSYRVVKGRVEMAKRETLVDKAIHRPDKTRVSHETRGPRPDISGIEMPEMPEISDKTTIEKLDKRYGKSKLV